MTERIALESIRTDGGTQTRATTDPVTIRDYADAMANGDSFPPIMVYHDGERYWLADGFHRVAAAKEAGFDQIEAHVRQGTRRDAVLYSVGANSTHGLKRTNADKRRAVETLLLDEEWCQWSDREIARRAGVSATFVGNMRAELAVTVNGLQSTVRKGADGREINVTNIGQRDEAAPEPEREPHWSDKEWYSSNFWREVNRLGLDRITVLDQLQSGATQLRDLRLKYDETLEALELLGTAEWRRLFAQGSYVTDGEHVSIVIGEWDEDSVTVRDLHLPEKAWNNQSWYYEDIRPATPEEVEIYRNRPAPASSPASVLRGSSLKLDKEVLDKAKGLGWLERHQTLRAALPEDTFLIAESAQGNLLLGDDAVRAEKILNHERSTVVQTEAGPVLAGYFSEWDLRAGRDIYTYRSDGMEFRQFVYLCQLMKEGKAPEDNDLTRTIAPGHLVKHKATGETGVVSVVQTYGSATLKMASLKPGERVEESFGLSYLEIVKAWKPGDPKIEPPPQPPFTPPPTPWKTKGERLQDATGTQLGYVFGSRGRDIMTAQYIAESVNRRAQYEAFIGKIANPPAGLLTPQYLANLLEEAAALLAGQVQEDGDAHP